MVFIKLDRNTFIHRPIYETKEPISHENLLKPVRVLSNNIEYQNYTPTTMPSNNQPTQYSKLIDLFKETAQLISIIKAIVTDILSDGYIFESLTSSELPENRALKFCKLNNFRNIMEKVLLDYFIYGNGFIVINVVTDDQIKSVLNTSKYEMKDVFEFKEAKIIIDEISFKNVRIQHLPAQTVSIYSNDDYGEDIVYKQTVGLKTILFNASEVIHFKDVDIDGKLYGYSRLYSMKSEIQTLWNATNYIGKFFDNNGTPNLLFKLIKSKYGSPEYNDLLVQLKELKKSENKQKNLVFAGNDIDVIKLNDINKDMQFENLLKYITSVMAMGYQMPSTRYGASTGGNAEEATLTNQGYYRNISSYQSKLENDLNVQLFNPFFNCDIKFNRYSKEDQIRQINIDKSMTDVAEQRLRLGLWNADAAQYYLGISNSELGDSKKDLNISNLENNYMQNQKSKSDLQDEPIQNSKKLRTPKSRGGNNA